MNYRLSAIAAAFAAAIAVSAAPIDNNSADPRWTITAQLPVADYYGATVANGNIGITSSDQPLRNRHMILAGTFDRAHANDVLRLHSGYNLLDMTMSVDGKEVTADNITDFTQRLNLRRSKMECSFTVPGKLEVSYETLAVGGMPGSVLTAVEMRALSDVTIEVSNSLDTPAKMHHINGVRPIFNTTSGDRIEFLSASAKTPCGRLTVGAASGFIFDQKEAAMVKILTPDTAAPDSATHMIQSFEVRLKKGENFEFALAGSTFNSNMAELPQNAAERAVSSMKLEGIAPAMKRHNEYWDRMWQGDIEIDGPDTDQQDIRYMIYSIYSAIQPDDSASPSPFGLTTTGYSGHVFWDTDLWMYPPMLVLNPGIARSMTDYRTDRLKGALANYRNSGGRALYPWESAADGMEETPISATTGIQEIHISACVALALWQRFLAQQDMEWLREKAYPAIKATADFWVERASKEEDGKWHICNVVGADEFAENVDDNAFTNAAARKNLQVAAKAARLLGTEPDPRWEEVAEGIALHQLDNGVTAEFRGFDGKTAKQADVNLLAYPLGEITDPEQIERDLDYYTSVISLATTPAMTEAIFSILYNRIGKPAEAERFFRQSFTPNQFGPFRGVSECKGGRRPYFITGAGGALQAILMGYGGFDITDEGIRAVYHPVALPSGWKSLTIHRPDNEPYTVISGKKAR